MRKNVIMTKVMMLLKVIMTKRVIFRLSKPKNLLTKTKKSSTNLFELICVAAWENPW